MRFLLLGVACTPDFGEEKIGNGGGLVGLKKLIFFSKSNRFLLKLNPRNEGYGGINGVEIKQDGENLDFIRFGAEGKIAGRGMIDG